MAQAINTVITSRNRLAALAAQVAERGLPAAHARMIERLAETAPDAIRFNADEDDLLSRSLHLRRTMEALRDYVGECVQDASDSCWSVKLDRRYVAGCFNDLIGEVCCHIHNAAETLREEAQAA